jgi:hypothetical protein
LLTQNLSFTFFFSFGLREVFAFYSFCSDNKKLKGKTGTAPIVDTPAYNKPPSPEAGVVVKSREAPAKKGNSRASKRLKKAAVISTSLDTHRPVTSGDDVSTSPCSLFFELFGFFCSYFPFIDFDEEVHLFGH